MDLSLNPEQQMLKDSAARFVSDRFGVDERRRLRDAGEVVNPAHWAEMAELGWLGLPFSEEHGGYGGTIEEVMVLMEELGRGLVTEPYLSSVLLCGGLLSRCGDETALQHLQRIIAGESRPALAFAEGGRRFALDAIRTQASGSDDGYRISGRKCAVVNGAAADSLLVTAMLDGTPALMLVTQVDAVTRRPVTLVDGNPGAELLFEDTPATVLHADVLPLLQAVVDEVLVAMGAQAVGSMETLLNMTVEYTRTREQFGQPIGKFQALQHRMADMYLQCQSLRGLLLQAVLAHNEGRPDRARASSALKVKLGEAGRFVSQQAVQLHGGIGMSDELAVSHHLKSLLSLNTMFGDSDYHLDRYLRLGEA